MGTFRRDDLGKREMCGENVTHKGHRLAKTRLFVTPVTNKRSTIVLFDTIRMFRKEIAQWVYQPMINGY